MLTYKLKLNFIKKIDKFEILIGFLLQLNRLLGQCKNVVELIKILTTYSKKYKVNSLKF